MVRWSSAPQSHALRSSLFALDRDHLTQKMMSHDQIENEKKFIQQEKDKIFKPNPERECRKAFYQELKESHPDLAMTFPELPQKKKKY